MRAIAPDEDEIPVVGEPPPEVSVTPAGSGVSSLWKAGACLVVAAVVDASVFWVDAYAGAACRSRIAASAAAVRVRPERRRRRWGERKAHP